MAANTYVGYNVPGSQEALTGLRGLQTQATSGLSDLMGSNFDADRQQYQDALYASQESNITRAMEQQLDRLLEGQFAKGAGHSTGTVDMTGELNRNYLDSLAGASREAYLGAGAENRANLAARQNLYTGGFNAGTQGIQAEANIGLANAQRQQQANQFGQSLDMQQQQIAAQQQQMQQQIQFNYAQLAQQASQFGATLDYNTQQALMNRAQQMALAQMQSQFNYAQLGQQNNQFGQQMGFNYAQLGQQGNQFTSQQDLQRQIAANNLAYQYAQLAQQNNQFNQGLDANADNRLNTALGTGLAGLSTLFAPTLNSIGGAANDWLTNLLGIPSAGRPSDDVLRQLGLLT